MTFPTDDYTPHGYLDIAQHTRNLTPRGVARSHGAGFRWHFPAYTGGYGGREIYRAGFRVALDGALELAQFARARSPYHSKNIIAFELSSGGAAPVEARYQVVGEHALACVLTGARHTSRITIHAEYTRLLSAQGGWGESGLVGRLDEGLLVLQGFEDGDVFVVWASQPWSDIGIARDPGEAARWAGGPAPGLPADGFVTAIGRRGEAVALHAALGFAPAGRLEIVMARGRTLFEARRHLEQAQRSAAAEHARKLAEDEQFWSRAPCLEGDWPAHWRRGLVYDLETLRMMVKQPLGIYRHCWDAMQIQAPRVVLAEAAFDALLLAYADPQLAQELLLGTLLDALAPNVPCSREDGSCNMVAADGTLCGTAPAWGYPFAVSEWLWALRPQRSWLEQLYPRLAEHLEWWLAHRRVADGWLFYACSWESGQDDSPRFGPQPLGGGHPVRHVRPVDLHAAVAHAAGVLAQFAAALGRTPDRLKWMRLAEEFSARVFQLWDGRRYADFDTRAGRFTPVDDIMLLAPLALRLPNIRPPALAAVGALDAGTLTWPMHAWTAVEAALAAGQPDIAAELAATICERAYRCWDARELRPGQTLPGIACEYWPLDGRCGGEGYGWGAFTTHLLLHALVGITPGPGALRIRPNLPPAWRAPGRHYGLRLRWRDRPLQIELAPLAGGRVAVTANGLRQEARWGEELTISHED